MDPPPRKRQRRHKSRTKRHDDAAPAVGAEVEAAAAPAVGAEVEAAAAPAVGAEAEVDAPAVEAEVEAAAAPAAPPTYLCPIGGDVVVHPVHTEAGIVYDFRSLGSWRVGTDVRDPTTGDVMQYFAYKRVWDVDEGSFKRAVEAGTVNTVLRKYLRKTALASGYLLSIEQAPRVTLNGIVKNCLDRASRCTSGLQMLQGPLQELAVFLLDNSMAVANQWLLDWTISKEGRALQAQLTTQPLDKHKPKVEGVLIMMLHRPNDRQFMRYASVGLCYYGSGAEELFDSELAKLIKANREFLAALAQGDIGACGYGFH